MIRLWHVVSRRFCHPGGHARSCGPAGAALDRVTWNLAGKTTLFRFADGDAGMRNIAVAALGRRFSGTHVAAALGLTTNYVATLHQRAQRDGTAGLVRPRAGPAR